MHEDMKKVFLRFQGASVKKTRLSRLSCKRVNVIGNGWPELQGIEGGIGDTGVTVEGDVALPLPLFNKVSKQDILSGI